MGNVMMKSSRAFIALALTFPAMAWSQALHPDYLDANAGSPQLRRLSPNVPSANAVAYRSRLMGYVQSANANEAPAGTAVRAEPTTASDVLATIEEGDSITVTRSGEWSQVVLRRPLGGPAPLNGAEVEPVVLGREPWAPGKQPIAESSTPGDVSELDPLETEQDPPSKITLPVEPPGPLPAVSLNRNYEGRLILKPRRLGLQKEFPYQLLNPVGKRIAYVDVSDVKAVDSFSFSDRQVTILGTMEPIKQGSSKKVIRARLIRSRN